MDYAGITKAIDANSSYLGISTLQLMENAGRAVAKEAERFERIAVFCGKGNNGGDGLVAARHLSSMGKEVRIYVLKGSRTEANERNLGVLRKLHSIKIEEISDSEECEGMRKELADFDLLIDALLGVGAGGEPREPVKSLIRVINGSKAFKLSVDIPTPGIEADLTLSFHLAKTRDAKVAGIGIPREAEACCGPGDVLNAIPPRKGDEHKGEFGRVLVVGGSREFTGAPALAGRAALRTGADLVTIMCPSFVAGRIPFDPNLMVTSLESEFYLSKEDVSPILERDFDSIVIGNGLSQQESSKYALKKLLRNIGERRVVLDADALKLAKPSWLREGFILTPHEGEFEKLFGDAGETLEEKKGKVEKRAKKTKATIVLKNPVDIISDGEETKLNPSGNPSMTVGGTGDALAGIMGAFQCWTAPFQAACSGTFLCGVAGDLALKDLGYAIMATDLIDRIPDALRFCRGFE